VPGRLGRRPRAAISGGIDYRSEGVDAEAARLGNSMSDYERLAAAL
jgi:hypothetical protein